MQEPVDLGQTAENAEEGVLCLRSSNGIRHEPPAGGKVLISARFRLAIPQGLVFESNRGEFGNIFETDDDMAQVGDRRMAVVEIELIPELFSRMSMHPAEAALDRVG